jgi:predicted Zn-dependent protease
LARNQHTLSISGISAFGRGAILALVESETIVTQFHINHPTFPAQEQAVNDLIELALQVAKNQRGEDHLQPLETVKAKFWHEMVEFEQAQDRIEKLSELADLVYYQVQEFAHNGEERNLNAVVEHLATQCSVPVEQAYTVALVKYRLRAVQAKNFEVENAAIRAALEE